MKLSNVSLVVRRPCTVILKDIYGTYTTLSNENTTTDSADVADFPDLDSDASGLGG